MKKKQNLKMRIGDIREEIFNTLPKDVSDRLNKVVMGYCMVEQISSDNFLYGSEILSVKKTHKTTGDKFSDQYDFRLKHTLYKLNHEPHEIYHMVVQYMPGKHVIITEQNKEGNETTYRTPRADS